MLEKIVVAYGGERGGNDAVALARKLAALSGGQLVVAFPYHPALARETAEQTTECVRARVQPLLGGAAGDEPSARAVAGARYRWSSSSWPIRALHELAAHEDAELIVIGAARERIAERLTVDLMERMVHGAPCAVAVAPAGYADAGTPLRRIGVGFTSSPEGRAAARLARELAARGGDGVRVIAGASLEPALAEYAFSSPALGELQEEIYTDTMQTLAHVCEQLSTERGPAIEPETVRGEPAEILIERSADLDLLVLGSRAYGPLRHALLGSVSAAVMRAAHCPVLVVPRGCTVASTATQADDSDG